VSSSPTVKPESSAVEAGADDKLSTNRKRDIQKFLIPKPPLDPEGGKLVASNTAL